MRQLIHPLLIAGLLLAIAVRVHAQANDPLPSWNDRQAKQNITVFVNTVTTENSPDFVPPTERIAVFDNDGTLWPEQPMYFQLAFALDRVKTLAPEHPEWKTTQPFKAALEGDLKTLFAGGEHALLELVMNDHRGIRDRGQRLAGHGETPEEQTPIY